MELYTQFNRMDEVPLSGSYLVLTSEGADFCQDGEVIFSDSYAATCDLEFDKPWALQVFVNKAHGARTPESIATVVKSGSWDCIF